MEVKFHQHTEKRKVSEQIEPLTFQYVFYLILSSADCSLVLEATPFIPDLTVEKIGGAFVDEERSLKPLYRTESECHTQHTCTPAHLHTQYFMSCCVVSGLEIGKW